MKPTDKQLLLSCRRGDETAWEALIHRYQRLIYAIPRRAGLDEEQSADVFQDVFVTLFEKLDEIDRPERLQAWLVTTARRKTWRVITKQKALREAPGHKESAERKLMDLPDGAPPADEVLVLLEKQHQVRVAVAALDERCGKLMKLLFYAPEPPSYSEIASKLGIPEGSIGPTRARCLEKLMRLLQS